MISFLVTDGSSQDICHISVISLDDNDLRSIPPKKIFYSLSSEDKWPLILISSWACKFEN